MCGIGVIGASHAGLSAALALRQEGYAGPLTIVGDEPLEPYDRPPLSKQVLTGEWARGDVMLPFDAEALGAEWRLGRAAIGLDAEARAVRLDDGSTQVFQDGVVIATGAKPRRGLGDALAGVHVLRTLDDSIALASDLAEGPRHVAIVGGGFIGAEVAAACVALDVPVTILEALSAPFERILGPDLGDAVGAIHRSRGVEVRTGSLVERLRGDASARVTSVCLSGGDELAADVVVLGIGVEPCTAWLQDSGLVIEDGVVCDPSCLAAPGVVVAGDVARWPSPDTGLLQRVEHWDNAIRQAGHAARRLLGHDVGRYAPVPWFWSDQYGRKLQLVGTAAAYDEVEVVVGSIEAERFVALFRRDDRLIGAFAIGCVRELNACRRLLADTAAWEDAVNELVALGA
ncbi:NAD(P)/FAD-dependent oxidoreductase [Capillimicrobium parvum]|uniref:Dicamba O-demethylase 1, ferredoxin reductase component n=1 Tax=Capillimicrobium parvum TaxID=2884022 RepID=A0A9E6XRR7_9ACTN|nr:FAD-dependent oxidoreductase [Capillimicrobium parvum]UGS33678.1 Dicamba O-demethylase 1, ferredoxin reductase component [Capillimicrobium parvum]